MIGAYLAPHEHHSWLSANWVLAWVTLLLVALLALGVGLALKRR